MTRYPKLDATITGHALQSDGALLPQLRHMTRIVDEHDVYHTSDLALAAALTLFYPLDTIDRHADGPVFVFRRAADLDNLVERYWRGALRVEPQTYCQHINRLQYLVCTERASD